MTWVPPFKALPRAADDLICGAESGAEVVYAECREAEEAADRRHDFSDHLEPYGCSECGGQITSHVNGYAGHDFMCHSFGLPGDEAAWSWHMGPDR